MSGYSATCLQLRRLFFPLILFALVFSLSFFVVVVVVFVLIYSFALDLDSFPLFPPFFFFSFLLFSPPN